MEYCSNCIYWEKVKFELFGICSCPNLCIKTYFPKSGDIQCDQLVVAVLDNDGDILTGAHFGCVHFRISN